MHVSDITDLTALLDLLLDVICVVDSDGRFLFVSAGCEQVFGYTRDEMIGKPMIDLVHPDDRERTLQAASEIMEGTEKPIFENRYIHKNGTTLHIMWSARWSEHNQLRIAMARDVTRLKRAETMRDALHAISEAAHSASDVDMLYQQIHHIVGRLLNADNFFVALYDHDHDVLSFPYFVDQYDTQPAPRPLATGTLTAEVISSGKPLLLTPDTRDTLPEHLQVAVGCDALDWLGVPLVAPQGVIGALVVQTYSGAVHYTAADVELLEYVSVPVAAAIERKQMQTRLEFSAQYDHLTGLPNRQLFNDRLNTALARARRSKERLALLYLDLDRFKEINDTFGHAVGDRMLEAVAERLRSSVRESDTICRIGGDEFVVLLENIGETAHALLAADKVLAALRLPLVLENRSHRVRPSIGIALYPDHGKETPQLLSQADKAMYSAKRQGGNRYQVAELPEN
jgi:diguanylate cyclase (GGDEF)-like protein/PAS domain S-box-containing protein